MHYPDSYVRPAADTGLIQDIAKAINGQYSAVLCYDKLAKLAPTESERNRILEIRNDEMRHLQVFSHIYRSLTGRQPVPQMTEPCANEYKAGLQAALIDEQETVDFYLDIADKAYDRYVKEQFRRAAADEQNHAVWFLYFYTRSL